MEKIENGKYFEIAYDLYAVEPDGTETLVHQMTADEPDRAIYGSTVGFVEALDKELEGKTAGDTFDFYADPADAFGPYSDENIATIPREQLTYEGKFDEELFTPGNYVPLLTADGYQIDGLVADVTPEAVVFDLNHPLAKSRVHYVGKVVTVRNPTEEELNPKQGCCGCGGGCCGGEGDGGECGEGCGCGK